MTTLTVTAKGQVTLKQEILKHLGVRPGARLDVDLLPDGRAVIQAARRTGSIDAVVGLLASPSPRAATIEDINEATAAGWAGEVR